MMPSKITPQDLQGKLKTDQELAFLDVREQGVYAQGHPLFAVSLSLSRLELDIERLVPRKTTPIYLLDQGGDDTLSVRAARSLSKLGFSDLSIVDGGLLGWHEAGLEVFSGVNVPSKAFGEFVEMENETPHISADNLAEKLKNDDAVVILDSRPFDEFHRMCIPGGIDMPGAELVHRIFETIQDDTTPIVVNCAGRTRSILGAQSLRNAGIQNPVMALKDGTMGWYLAGNKLEYKAERVAEEPSPKALQKAIDAAVAVADKAGIREISIAELNALQEQADNQNVFVLDTRTKDEYLAGHVIGSQHSPGGQLVQATDEYVGVRNATLVLVDDQQVRALMTASWLKQMGWQKVSVFYDVSELEVETGAGPRKKVTEIASVNALELDAVISSGEPVAVLDLANSLKYRDRHIPGAHWIIRSRLAQDLVYLPPVGMIVVTADDDRLAHLAAVEMQDMKPQIIIRVLQGGNSSWYDAGLRTEMGDNRSLSEKDDLWYKPYDNKEKIKERMQEYLDWEVALITQVERDGAARFNILAD